MKAGPSQELTRSQDSLPFPLGKNKNKVIYGLSCFFLLKHELVLVGCPDASPLTEFDVSVQEDEKKRIIFRIVTFETFEIRTADVSD